MMLIGGTVGRERYRRDSERVLNWGPSMQMRVEDAWRVGAGLAVNGVVCEGEGTGMRMPEGERARWRREERCGSKGEAMEMWPTMPFSKNVQGRTWDVING